MFGRQCEVKHLIFTFVIFSATILLIADLAECKRNIKLPDYLHLCKKEDPQLNKCLGELFESLRPKLDQGIPEINLPPLDPLTLNEIVVFGGNGNANAQGRSNNGQMRVVAHNVKVTGVKNMQVRSINANLPKLEVKVRVHFPKLHFEGIYDVNAKFVNIPVKGKGPMKGNATEVTADALLKGKLVHVDNEPFINFTSANVDVTLKGYRLRVDKLFADKKLNEAINQLLNDPQLQGTISIKPLMNKLAGDMLLNMVNKISINLSFDELFAQK